MLHAALETDTNSGPGASARPTNTRPTNARPTSLHSGHRAPVISLAALVEGAGSTDASANPSTDPVIDAATGASVEPFGVISAGLDEAVDPVGAALWALLERRGWNRPADAEGMGQLLDAAGDARFRARAAFFAALNREQSPCQTLYEGLMEALGYRANRQPFLKLAQRAPWPALAAEAMAHPAQHRTAVLEARLLELSGRAEGGSGGRRRPAGYGAPLKAEEWHTFRVRPANHPRHRIAGAARLLGRFLEGALPGEATPPERLRVGEEPEDRLVRYLAAVAGTGSPAKLTAALAVPADWAKGAAYVGTGRARDLAVNVVLPFCYLLDGGEGESPALALYRKYPRLQENEVTREMADRLLQPGWKGVAAGARRQQGLIHLHRQLS